MMRFLISVSLVLAAACGSSKPAEPSKSSDPAASADAPLAVAIVMSGHEIWIGNDRIVAADDTSRYVGALDSVKAGLDEAKLGTLERSLGALIVYGDQARVKVPMGPIGRLEGKALGDQKDYAGTVASELVAGVELGLGELAKAKAGRKVLIVLSDGDDTNKNTGKTRLAALRERAMAEKIEVHAVLFKSILAGDDTAITALVPDAVVAKSPDDVKTQLAAKLATLRP